MRLFPNLIAACGLLSGAAVAQDFSIDSASPEVPGTMAASDGALTPGIPPVPLIYTGAGLGLPAGVEVDAFSYGVDQAEPMGSNSYMVLYTSVTRGSVGAPGSAVAMQTNGVAGDRYVSTANAVGGFTAQTLSTDAPLLGLTIPPGVESNIDGLAHPPGAAPVIGVYWSISAASGPLFGADQASILYNGPFNLPPGSPPIIYATSAALGLVPGLDEIDALVIDDKSPKTVFGLGDIIYVSLAPGSPTLFALGASPADLIQVSPGPPAVVITAAQLGLLATDDLDAATIFDPGPWSPLGGGKTGGNGVQPAIYGNGPLTAGSLNQLTIVGAPPFTPSVMFAGLSVANMPLLGGTLVPTPDVIRIMPATNANGGLLLPFIWPTGIPAGVTVNVQSWVLDPSASFDFSATNGEQATAQ